VLGVAVVRVGGQGAEQVQTRGLTSGGHSAERRDQGICRLFTSHPRAGLDHGWRTPRWARIADVGRHDAPPDHRPQVSLEEQVAVASLFFSNVGIAVIVWGVASRGALGVGIVIASVSCITMIIATRADPSYFIERSRIWRVLRHFPVPTLLSYLIFSLAPTAWIIGLAVHRK
jgi:hypothetical protein